MSQARKILVLMLVFLIVPASAKALEMRATDLVNVGAEENIKGNLLTIGADINIDGKVNGDLICLGKNVIVNGTIDGDILCLAEKLTVNGPVSGSVRTVSGQTRINGLIARNITALSSIFVLTRPAKVAMDVMLGSSYAEIIGQIQGNLHGNVGKLTISGQIDQNVNVNIDTSKSTTEPSLVIKRPALIKGDLSYESDESAWIINHQSVIGKVEQQKPSVLKAGQEWLGVSKFWLLSRMIALFSAFVIASVAINFFKKQVINLADTMVARPVKNILWGLVFLIAAPLACLVTLFTIIGLPLAVIIILLWSLSILLGHALFSIMVGKALFGHYRYKLTKAGKLEIIDKNLFFPMLWGVVSTTVIFSIPWLGPLLSIVSIAWAVGAIWQSARA